jgi:hypothetical protein
MQIADYIERCGARLTFSRMSVAFAVQTNGLGFSLGRSMWSLMAVTSSSILRKASRHRILGQIAEEEETLHHVQPGAAGGREVHVKTRVAS